MLQQAKHLLDTGALTEEELEQNMLRQLQVILAFTSKSQTCFLWPAARAVIGQLHCSPETISNSAEACIMAWNAS